MKRGQKPSRHIRVVRTRKGMKAVSINPMINKNVTNKQYKRMMKRIAPFADYDKDGVRNIDDCRPFDKKRQDEFHITARNKKTGERRSMFYPSLESAQHHNPGFEDFEYRGREQ
jgi:hypothetical protein